MNYDGVKYYRLKSDISIIPSFRYYEGRQIPSFVECKRSSDVICVNWSSQTEHPLYGYLVSVNIRREPDFLSSKEGLIFTIQRDFTETTEHEVFGREYGVI